jgi:hypothetical protein
MTDNQDQRQEDDKEKPKASLRKFKEGAGIGIWTKYIHSEAADINRRHDQVGVIYWYPAERMPIDLFSYIREASRCYTLAQYLAAITMSSSAIELILNQDQRTKDLELKRIGDWATLRNDNLNAAGNLGLPVSLLVDSDEDITQKVPIKFVNRRNKVAHGDVNSFLLTLSDYDSSAESEAFDQIMKAQRFVVEWFNTSPDVQIGSIADHRWPK